MNRPRNTAAAPRRARPRSAGTVKRHLRRAQQTLDGLLVEVGLLRNSLTLPSAERRRRQLDEEEPVTLEVHLAGVLKILGLVIEEAEAVAADGLWWTSERLREAWKDSQENRPFLPEDWKLLRKPILEHRNPGEAEAEA